MKAKNTGQGTTTRSDPRLILSLVVMLVLIGGLFAGVFGSGADQAGVGSERIAGQGADIVLPHEYIIPPGEPCWFSHCLPPPPEVPCLTASQNCDPHSPVPQACGDWTCNEAT